MGCPLPWRPWPRCFRGWASASIRRGATTTAHSCWSSIRGRSRRPTSKPQVEAFVRYLKATPPAEGFDEVLYPGEIEYRTEQRRRRTGIPIEDTTWRRLGETAARYGISLPGTMPPE